MQLKLLCILGCTFCMQIFGLSSMLEQTDSEQFKSEMLSFLSLGEFTDPSFNQKIEKTTKSLPVGSDEAVVMQDIWQLLAHNPSLFQKVLNGAHVRVLDNGFLYFKWEELESARARISSHPSIPGSSQYGIVGPISHEILFGIVEIDGDILTFFQFENTPWDSSLKNMVWHSMDAIQYLITGKNIGPYGRSEHTDKNPLLF